MIELDSGVALYNAMKSIGENYEYVGNFLEGKVSTINDEKLKDQFHHEQIKSLDAWKVSTGSESIIVAVTDNEFEMDHDDLTNAWWVNANEIPGNGIDDDNNGYIDDIHGWNFLGNDKHENINVENYEFIRIINDYKSQFDQIKNYINFREAQINKLPL